MPGCLVIMQSAGFKVNWVQKASTACFRAEHCALGVSAVMSKFASNSVCGVWWRGKVESIETHPLFHMEKSTGKVLASVQQSILGLNNLHRCVDFLLGQGREGYYSIIIKGP